MTNESDGNAPRHPLYELIGQLNCLGGTLKRFADHIDRWQLRLDGWTLCFHSSGELAGAIDEVAGTTGAAGITSYDGYQRDRRNRLIAAKLLPASQIRVQGETYQSPEWESKAKDAGVVLPRLIEPVEYDSAEWDEASYAADWWRNQFMEKHGWDGTSDTSQGTDQSEEIVGAVSVEPAPEPTMGSKLARQTLEVSELAEWLAGCLQSTEWLGDSLDGVEKAAKALPRDILKALDGLDGTSWRPRLFRRVLMPIAGWRGTDGVDHLGLPRTQSEFVEKLFRRNPRDFWLALADQIDSAISDLYAVAPELHNEGGSQKWPPIPQEVTPDEQKYVEAARSAYLDDPERWFSLQAIADLVEDGEHESLRKASAKLQRFGLLEKRFSGRGFRAGTQLAQKSHNTSTD